MTNKSVFPLARKEELTTEEVGSELLVYDQKRHKAHCLDRTVGAIWKCCDGKTDITGIAGRLQKQFSGPLDEQVVWVGLKRLGRAHLLEDRLVPPSDLIKNQSRRALMKKVAMVGGLSVLSILVPTAAQAASQCVSCGHYYDKYGHYEIGKPCCEGGNCVRIRNCQ